MRCFTGGWCLLRLSLVSLLVLGIVGCSEKVEAPSGVADSDSTERESVEQAVELTPAYVESLSLIKEGRYLEASIIQSNVDFSVMKEDHDFTEVHLYLTCGSCEGGICPECGGEAESCEACSGSGACLECENKPADKLRCGTCACRECGARGVCKTCRGAKVFRCKTCEGRGKLANYTRCSKCKGEGRILWKKESSGFGSKSLSSSKSKICSKCRGHGKYSTTTRTCSTCTGEGHVDCSACRGSGRCRTCKGAGRQRECQACNSTGIVLRHCEVCSGDRKCNGCDGSGEIECVLCQNSGECDQCLDGIVGQRLLRLETKHLLRDHGFWYQRSRVQPIPEGRFIEGDFALTLEYSPEESVVIVGSGRDWTNTLKTIVYMSER